MGALACRFSVSSVDIMNIRSSRQTAYNRNPYVNQCRNTVFLKNRKIANPKLVAPRPQTSFISRGTTPGRSYGTRGMPTRTPVTFEELLRSPSYRFRIRDFAIFQKYSVSVDLHRDSCYKRFAVNYEYS